MPKKEPTSILTKLGEHPVHQEPRTSMFMKLAGSDARQAISPPVEPMRKPHERKLGKGHEHGMKPVVYPDSSKIKSFDSMLSVMSETTAAAKDLGLAANVVEAMVRDKSCKVVLTLSGNATVFSPLIAELIDRGIVNCIVTTGSVVTHSFSLERGRPMFQIDDPEAVDDNWFYNRGYNRIYDVVELESSLDEGYKFLEEALKDQRPNVPLASADVTELLGNFLNEKYPKVQGFLHSAERAGVPAFVPSFSDCEIGLDFHAQNLEREKKSKEPLFFDAFEDWRRYCAFAQGAKTLGIITLGGGVPRNWAQQVGPFFDILTGRKMAPKELLVRFKYAVRICHDPTNLGSLSGCTYAEGRSWGKFLPEGEGGMNAEVFCDYTLAFPILVQAILERL